MFPEDRMGLWQCKLRYRTQDEVLSVARQYQKEGIHIDQIGAEEHPAIRQRSIHLQHGGMRLQVGIAAGAAGTPEVMFQGDVQILLTIKVGGIAADPTLQPVIMLSLRVSRVKVSLSCGCAGVMPEATIASR